PMRSSFSRTRPASPATRSTRKSSARHTRTSRRSTRRARTPRRISSRRSRAGLPAYGGRSPCRRTAPSTTKRRRRSRSTSSPSKRLSAKREAAMTRIPVLVVALVLAAASGCSEKKSSPSGKASVVIGSVAPLTGGIAHLGKDNENGARLAIEEANAAGTKLDGKDVQCELIAVDDQTDPTRETTVA